MIHEIYKVEYSPNESEAEIIELGKISYEYNPDTDYVFGEEYLYEWETLNKVLKGDTLSDILYFTQTDHHARYIRFQSLEDLIVFKMML